MIFRINKLFFKVASLYKLIVINILFIAILLLFSESGFSNDIIKEKNLAYKYCKSVESNMFKGLDNEKILKNEYFFNSINKEEINDEIINLSNFSSEVENICSYKLNSEEKEEFQKELKKYLSIN
tara:strand:+ start:63 stop:437 length:375 start_codon:yes stop_codon:yes gene_type:complete